MERKLTFSVGEFYHLYNRGVDKRLIFLSDADRRRFKRLLYVCNSEKPLVYRDISNKPLSSIELDENIVAIGSYCLMPNHFHILVKEITEGGISRYMGKLLTSYSSYFNKKSKRTGRLFEGTFKAEHVITDNHLKYLYSYIHLNPIKLIQPDWKESGIKSINQAKKHLEKYEDSSYVDYCGVEREVGPVLNRDVFPDYFEDVDEMEKQVQDWLEYSQD